MEPVSFPDVEDLLVLYLRAKVPDARISTAYKGGPREVRVGRVGGATWSPAHDAATVLFECWADDAHALANEVRAHVMAYDGDAAWYSRREGITGFTNFPDPLADKPRWQFTATIRTHGEAI